MKSTPSPSYTDEATIVPAVVGAPPSHNDSGRPSEERPRFNRSIDRILNGPLAVEAARFGFPLAVGMGLQTTFNLVDAYIIARLQGTTAPAAMAAIANCDNVAAVGTILSYGLSIATGTIISRRHGEGDEEGVRRVAWQSLLLLMFLSVAFAAIGLFGADFLLRDVMNAKGQVAEVGVPYLQVTMAGSGSIFL